MKNKVTPVYFILLLLIACNNKEDNAIATITSHLQFRNTDTLINGGIFKFFRNTKIDTIIEIGNNKIKGTIGVISFQENRIIGRNIGMKDSLLAFKTMKDGKVFMSFDCNGNKSFSDEMLYQCDSGIKLLIDSIKILNGGKILQQKLYVSPERSTLNFEFKSADKLAKYGVSIIPIYKYGELSDSDKIYQIVVTNMLQNFYSKENTVIYVLANKINEPNFKLREKPLYQFGDTLYLKNGVYQFVSIDSFGQNCFIRKLSVSANHQGIEAGDMALSFEMENIKDRSKIKFSTDKYTLLDFWGTWCTPCRELTPDIEELYNTYGSTKIKLISIASDDSKAVLDYIEGQKIKWENVVDPLEAGPICKKYKIHSFPTFILIDKKGKIVYRGIGKNGLEKIKLILEGD